MKHATILRWTGEELSGLGKLGLAEVWTEVDDSGRVTREIGLTSNGEVAYVAPSDHSRLGRGLFDNQVVKHSGADNGAHVPEMQFEELWRRVHG